jgi:uncharacterized membrane protein YdjX (TVP38/TMEM64 family)
MKKYAPLLVLIAAVALVLVIPPARATLGRGLYLLSTGQLAQFQQYLQSLGAWAPIASIGLMLTEAVAVPVPVTIVMVANGLVFGVWTGALVSLAGGLAGALAAYAIGRHFGRVVVERLVPAAGLRAVDGLMARYGRWALVLARWIPGVPGDPMSYAAGLTRTPFLVFLGLTAVGLVPATLATALLGDQIAGDIPMRYWVSGLGGILVAWLIWRAVRRRRSSKITGVETRPR